MNSKDDRFNAVFGNSNVGIVISNEKGEIEEINPFASQVFGYDDGELIGKKVDVLVPINMKDKHYKLKKDYLKNPISKSIKFDDNMKAIKKCGSEFPIEIELCSYRVSGSLKLVSFVHDVTERLAIEKLLEDFDSELESKVETRTKQFAKALSKLGLTNRNLKKSEAQGRKALEKEKELNEMKSRFVSLASHEFRTPLAGILISTTLIEKYNNTAQANKLDKHIAAIRHSVKNLTNVLNDFLSLDKLNQGAVKISPKDFNIKDFVQAIVEDATDFAQRRQAIFYKHKGAGENVFMDQNILRNIFINLISNAMKYSPNNEDIFIETKISNKNLKIIVRDKGIGIPELEQKHLFEKFFRARNALNIEGTGLGLNIVKGYLKLMGGTINFKSKEKKGTTFTIVLNKEKIK
jgi:PAS domain S-box-containing protein